MSHWVDPEDKDFNPKKVRSELRQLFKVYEKELKDSKTSQYLKTNINHLSKLVSLSVVDCRILEFSILVNSENLLDDVADWIGDLTTIKLYRVLSVLLDISEKEIKKSLSSSSILANAGRVTVDRSPRRTLTAKLDLLSEEFTDRIVSAITDPIDLLRGTVSSASQPHLTLEDYQHLNKELKILTPYLKHSLLNQRKGVNIFFHGSPGTGKTEFTKVLAKLNQCQLFEIASEDEDPIDGSQRLKAFSAAQNFFAKQGAFILFDEVEDVFDDGNGLLGKKSTAQSHKAWMNRILEENSVITFWLSNSISELDPAFIRRFDLVIELPVPPKKQRLKIIKNSCSDFLSQPTMERISNTNMLSPAVVNRVASVMTSIKDDLGSDNIENAFELMINNTLETQGHKTIPANDQNQLPKTYNHKFINADSDVKEIAEGLKKVKSGRFCLYGPPGTGKTAYGRWLSEQLELPLIVKRGSDLISMWVGGTEKNIAQAFKEAETDGAILMIDEVDGFLQDRRGAENSWEITAVNEMLTQMESFSGIFIASTNLMSGLEQAALRRFDLKINFDFLLSEQAWLLLSKYCQQFTLPEPDIKLRNRLKLLTNVTPGDFAAIARRNRFKPIKSANELIEALSYECGLKEGAKRAIGFM